MLKDAVSTEDKQKTTALGVAEIELLKARERLHFLVSATPVVIYSCEAVPPYAATFISNTVRTQLGYEPEEFVTDPDFWAGKIHPEDAPNVFAVLSRLPDEGHHIYEYRFLHKDGTYRWMHDEMRLIRDETGSPMEILGYWIDITERKEAEEKTRFSNVILSTQQQASIDGILVVDDKGGMISFNRRFVEMWGIPFDVVDSRSDERALQAVMDKLNNPEGFTNKVRYLYEHRNETSRDEIELRDGRTFDRYSAPMFGEDGRYYGRVWYFRDITERKEAEESIRRLNAELEKRVKERTAELEEANKALREEVAERKRAEEEMKKLSLAVERASDWVLITDRDGNIEYLNRSVEEISGYKKEELMGQNPRIFRSGKHDEKFFKEMWDTILSGSVYRVIITNRKKNGELFDVYHTITPLKDDNGKVTHFIATAKDMTQQRLLEDRLNYLAYYDSLTGLPNRTLFVDRLDQTLSRAEYDKKLVSVLSIDIDRFSFINDTFGTEIGDRVLKEVGKRLSETLREGDTVARLGSDEFGISLVDIAHSEDVVLLVQRLIDSIRQPINLEGEDIVLTSSIGVSIYPEDGNDARTLVNNSNVVMSRVKSGGMNNYQFYTAGINARAKEFVMLERGLYEALKNNEFILHYQPYYDTSSRTISGMEALIRWNSPELGMVPPGRFIPVLEETRMIIEVGQWILETACRQIKEWQDKGYMVVPIAVNFSSIQFRQKDFGLMLARSIKESGIDPRLLTVEITESTFMQDAEFTRGVLEGIKKLGVSVNIDDFGTGYSSLSYLKRLPVDNLKIDISFIREIADNPDDATIVNTIISMAHNLGLKTIAEGVENEEQWKILRILRCDMIQGYYFNRPLSAEDAEEIFKSGA